MEAAPRATMRMLNTIYSTLHWMIMLAQDALLVTDDRIGYPHIADTTGL